MITGMFVRGDVRWTGIVRYMNERERLERDVQIARAEMIHDRNVLRAGPRVNSGELPCRRPSTEERS